jgi:hypothetical protein
MAQLPSVPSSHVPPHAAEAARLAADARRDENWKRWGPYLSERQWGTVREDYSPGGDAWNAFPHDHARSRAYRWGEDGLLGFTDRECRLCFAVALWNEKDPILKERLFGLTGPEGNHGEDVKEEYFYLDATPTYSYAKALYRYPQAEYPYARLIDESRRRTRNDREFELTDTGVFADNRFWDVTAEYAKASPDDLLVRIRIANRGPDPARLHVLPTLWFRNTWIWGCNHEGCEVKAWLGKTADNVVSARHVTLGNFQWEVDPAPRISGSPRATPARDAGPNGASPAFLFTDNETNTRRLWNVPSRTRFAKDAFHDYVIRGDKEAVNPRPYGTKAAAHFVLDVPAGGEVALRLRLRPEGSAGPAFGDEFDSTFARRVDEADAFYDDHIVPPGATPAQRRVSRTAYAGLLWSKQFYHYVVGEWLRGDADQPRPPEERKQGRNHDWSHHFARDVLSMPDKWEYPWFAAWDMAFHMIPMARVDPQFAKDQLLLMLREWYMHPNGQLPAYEFAFSDVNPPVHAWAVWRVYKMTGPRGRRDTRFLARCFQKLLMNFTWWVNRKDVKGKHIFAGGFLGLDNIGIFDRSQPLPTGGQLEQADGTAWMAFYCNTMLSMAIELAHQDPSYEDVASKFFEHYVAIVDAINTLGGHGLWDEEDGFYYDQIHLDGKTLPLRVRSLVGLIPLIASGVLEHEKIAGLAGFNKRAKWFLTHRRDLARHITYMECCGDEGGTGASAMQFLLALPTKDRLVRVLRYMLDESEFLSPYGVRSLSRKYKDNPYAFRWDHTEYRVAYDPAESTTAMFGGNSNWRGPVWLPVNYLLIEALERYHHFYGDGLRVECPTGSGNLMNLREVAAEISRRLTTLFLPDRDGHRPFAQDTPHYADPAWADLPVFHEYFDGDTGRGLGAPHQTGWTSLVTRLIEKTAPSLPRRLRKQRESASP